MGEGGEDNVGRNVAPKGICISLMRGNLRSVAALTKRKREALCRGERLGRTRKVNLAEREGFRRDLPKAEDSEEAKQYFRMGIVVDLFFSRVLLECCVAW